MTGNETPDFNAQVAQPNTWQPVAVPPRAMTQTWLVAGAGLLVALALGFAALQMFGEGLRSLLPAQRETLTYTSFDPANPMQPVDPTPAIVAHLQKVGGRETLPDSERAAIQQLTESVRQNLPLQVDAISTVVGAGSLGRHLVLDVRASYTKRYDDLGALRERMRRIGPGMHAGDICKGGPETLLRRFSTEYRGTIWHVYTFNDGNPPLFVEVPPQRCAT